MRFQSIADVQASLPPGIKVHWVKGQMHFTVRSSRKGKKVSLGTYLSPELAKRALANFKAGLPLELTQEELAQIADEQAAREAERERNRQERGMPSQLTSKEEMFRILHNHVPPHELNSSKPYFWTSPGGKTVMIPKEVVAEYFSNLAEGMFEEGDIQFMEAEEEPIDKDIWKDL